MWNSSKPIKFPHPQKLANQSTMNKAHVIEIKKALTYFYESKRSLRYWQKIKNIVKSDVRKPSNTYIEENTYNIRGTWETFNFT